MGIFPLYQDIFKCAVIYHSSITAEKTLVETICTCFGDLSIVLIATPEDFQPDDEHFH